MTAYTLHIDLETYSTVDLKNSGLYKYVQDPSFEILLLGYAWGNDPPRVLDLTTAHGRQNLESQGIIHALKDPDVVKYAYNAPFEIVCLHQFWPSPPAQWRCVMFHGLYCGYPAGLAAVSKAIGSPPDAQKMREGRALIRLFCAPQPDRSRIRAQDEPQKWGLFKQYCQQDVTAEREVEHRLSAWPVPEAEQALWLLDHQINARGVLTDQPFIESAIRLDHANYAALYQEARRITDLENPNSRDQIKAWLEETMKETLPDVTKATIKQRLKTSHNATVSRILEIRQEMAKTSVKKYTAMVNAAGSDGRIRGLLQFYGAARTGRWAGRLVQVQNLPQNHLETLDLARMYTKQGNPTALKLLYGNIPDTLSQLIRTALIPATGRFIVADFSAIEARVLAWLAGETWRNEVFAAHGKIYEASASAMFGVPLSKIVKGQPEYALRQKGKIAELALGYGGSVGSLLSMGALEMGLSETELPELVEKWRQASPAIPRLWKALNYAAMAAVQTGRLHRVQNLAFRLESDGRLTFLTIQLPSNRKLMYAQPSIKQNKFGWDALHYQDLGQDHQWGEQSTYGGKLTENIVQAIARDCLAAAVQRLESAGYKLVFHVHDEAVIEAAPSQTVESACALMSQPLSWAPGLILKAAGFDCAYYQKD
jgi:DNA polymerase